MVKTTLMPQIKVFKLVKMLNFMDYLQNLTHPLQIPIKI
jgi:hypothetical protein